MDSGDVPDNIPGLAASKVRGELTLPTKTNVSLALTLK